MRLDFVKNTRETIEVNMLLSMSKLNGSSASLSVRQQTPQDCLEMMEEIEKNFPSARIDFKFVYTDALYLNRDEQAAKTGERVLMQMTRHQEGFKKISEDRSIEFVSWNQMVLKNNRGGFESALSAMRARYTKDSDFARSVDEDTLTARRGGVLDKHDVEFILQELVVMELLRRQPSAADKIVIAYPGAPLKSDLFLRDSKRKHPLGKAEPVSHSAFWADVSSPYAIEIHKFSLPENQEKPVSKKYLVEAGAALGAFAMVAGGVAVWMHNAPKPDFTISEIDSGMIALKRGERTVIFPDRDNLHRQIVIADGRQLAANTRDDGYMAYQNGNAVRDYLKPSR